MKRLRLSAELDVPVDIVTEALAWIGARGSGKTHGAGKLVELLTEAGVPVVVLDPVGVWYGLRLAKDGKGRGLSIPVFGGLHGDVPLEPTAGTLIADLIVDKNLSAILDVSQFDTDADKARFTAAFAQRLFARKKKDPSVVHWVIDEAQEFVPQNPQPGEQMMLHHVQRVLKLGRNFGIGTSLLTQRPQETSKKALNQCQTVLAFRVTGPQERKAMKDWIAAHDLDQALVEKLPSLETGTCHVWSPAFLKISKEIRILPKETFDASATPKFGERRAARELAPIDLERIRKDMAATIEKSKADDPKELRARIASLERAIKTRADTTARILSAPEKVVEKRVEVSVLKETHIKRLEMTLCRAEKMSEATKAALAEVAKLLHLARAVHADPKKATAKVDFPRGGSELVGIPDRHPRETLVYVPDDGNAIGPSHRKVLNSVAWLKQIGISPATREQAAVFAGMTPNGGYYARIVGELKTAGAAVYPSAGAVALTPLGERLAAPGAAPQTVEELHADVLQRLGPSHCKIIQALITCYPEGLTRERVASECGMDSSGGYFSRLVGELKTMGLIKYPLHGWVRAADVLFFKGATAGML